MRRYHRPLITAIAVLVLALVLAGAAACRARPLPRGATPPAPPGAAEIPAEYQALVAELAAGLTHFEGTLKQQGMPAPGPTAFATELAYANGNVGPGLLTPGILELNGVLLDRLQAMGFKGVVLAIKFPLLKPDFPRSAEYLQFYKTIVAMCHQHDMKVLVEVGIIFAGTPYSPVNVDWSQYNTQTLLQGLQDQLVVVSREIRPDYLTLANEPKTDEALTGQKIPPADWAAFVADTLKKIDRSSGMLAGAGTGTWEDPAYIRGIMTMPGLDFIDLHIYPMNKDAVLMDTALDWAKQARTAGKRITVSEAWLWKATPAELGAGLGNVERTMNRDVWSFFADLDARYFRDVVGLADATGMDFVSFFWTRNFFAYLDYGATPHNATTARYNQLINQAGMSAVKSGALSPLGESVQAALNTRAAK